MSNTVTYRLRILYRNECGSIPKFSEMINVPLGTLKNVISRGIPPSYEILKAVAETFPNYSMDWLISGIGEMRKMESSLKPDKDSNTTGYQANEDNNRLVGEGDNRYLNIGNIKNIKEIMDKEKVSMELAQSIDLLQQKNKYLELRIRDIEAMLETKNALLQSKDDMIGMMQGFMDKK